MSYATLQKDLELITLKKDLEQALEKMVDFEEEVNRVEEEEESEEESEEEENTNILVRVSGGYLFGFALGYSIAKIFMYINGSSERSRPQGGTSERNRDKNNQR